MEIIYVHILKKIYQYIQDWLKLDEFALFIKDPPCANFQLTNQPSDQPKTVRLTNENHPYR